MVEKGGAGGGVPRNHRVAVGGGIIEESSGFDLRAQWLVAVVVMIMMMVKHVGGRCDNQGVE